MREELFHLRNLIQSDVKEYINFLLDPDVNVWLEDEVQNIKDFQTLKTI